MKYYARVKSYFGNDCGLFDSDEGEAYLTEGKLYPVEEMVSRNLFAIKSDDGNRELCLLTNCAHLNGGSWEILSEDDIDALVDDLWETVD